jgi:D-beta-D-heptose 7-phosphate kinase/D-beta-D-heptose 1-phosphate adenosyltransferase
LERAQLNPNRITEIADRIGRSKIVVLGDIMLDEYLYGAVERISPEAPVPVVEVSSSKILLGGAANVAANIKALGDEPILIGAVGEDEAAVKLSQLLKSRGIAGSYLATDHSRQTTIKTRIIAHGQQVVRADREDRHELDSGMDEKIFSIFQAVADQIKAVILSDYGKGIITKALLERIMAVCLEKGIFVAVDPKETHFHSYKRVSVITPNHHEAGFAYGRRIRTEEDLHDVGQGLLKKLEAKSILITQGGEGMTLFRSDAAPVQIPTFARKVFDVTGAGDTVIAAFVSATCAGADLTEAAVIANAGAGVTVGEIGTATVTVDQLQKELKLNLKNGNVIRTTIG